MMREEERGWLLGQKRKPRGVSDGGKNDVSGLKFSINVKKRKHTRCVQSLFYGNLMEVS